MFHRTLAQGLFIVAVFAVFLAMFGWAVDDVWLASTQWILIGIVFMLMAIYVRMSQDDDEGELKERCKVVKQGKKNGKKKSKHASFRLTEE